MLKSQRLRFGPVASHSQVDHLHAIGTARVESRFDPGVRRALAGAGAVGETVADGDDSENAGRLLELVVAASEAEVVPDRVKGKRLEAPHPDAAGERRQRERRRKERERRLGY